MEKIDAKHLEIAKLSAVDFCCLEYVYPVFEVVFFIPDVFLHQPFHNWMQQAEEDLLDKFIAQSTVDVEVSGTRYHMFFPSNFSRALVAWFGVFLLRICIRMGKEKVRFLV